MTSSLSSADIIRQALGMAGEVDNGRSEYHSKCVTWLNRLHEDVLSGSSIFDVDVGQIFPWALSERQKTLILKTPYETGGVTIANGSNTGTFTTAPSSGLGSFVDRHLKTDENPDYYKIISHTAGSANFTLDAEWAGPSLTNQTFKAIPLIYDLGSGVLRLVAPINIYRFGGWDTDYDGRIFEISVHELRANYPLARLYGKVPERFSTIYQDRDTYKIQFSTYVTQEMKIDLDWVPMPDLLEDSALSFPKLPLHKSMFFVYAMASMINFEKKNYEAYGSAKKEASVILRSMLIEKNRTAGYMNKQRGQLMARMDQVSNSKFRGIR